MLGFVQTFPCWVVVVYTASPIADVADNSGSVEEASKGLHSSCLVEVCLGLKRLLAAFGVAALQTIAFGLIPTIVLDYFILGCPGPAPLIPGCDSTAITFINIFVVLILLRAVFECVKRICCIKMSPDSE
jgi:hypothetical protein